MPYIASLSTDQALAAVRERSSRAIESANLSQIFGNNGRSGRSATGNFSLLAKATGLSRVHIGKILKGKVKPSYETLMKLSEVTGISLDHISGFIQEQKSGHSK